MKKGSCLLDVVEKLGAIALVFAAASTSFWYGYQEEEPDGITDLLNKRR